MYICFISSYFDSSRMNYNKKRKEEEWKQKNMTKEEGEIVTAVAINFISRAFVLCTYQLNCAVLYAHCDQQQKRGTGASDCLFIVKLPHNLYMYRHTCFICIIAV